VPLHARLAALGNFRLTVARASGLTLFTAPRCTPHAARFERVCLPGEFSRVVSTLEPSDWLLSSTDLRPDESVNPDLLLRMSAESPRATVHLIALETTWAAPANGST